MGVGLLLGGIVLTRFTFVVDGGERAVIFNQIRGVQNRVYGEGMHFRIPLLMVCYEMIYIHINSASTAWSIFILVIKLF